MKVNPLYVVIAVLVVAVVSLILFPRHDGADVARATGEVQAAQSEMHKALDLAVTVTAKNATLRLQADSARQREQYAELRLASAKTVFHKAALAAPVGCADVIKAAQDQQAAAEVALAAAKSQDSTDKARADNAERALAAIVPAAANLDTASTHLVRASKPSFLSRLKPRIFVGVVAGVDALGKPDAVAGVGLGWSF